MSMWFIILLVALILTALALFYLSCAVCRFYCFSHFIENRRMRKILVGGGIVLLSFACIWLVLGFANAIVCSIYFAMIWIITDIVFFFVRKIKKCTFKKYYAGGVAVALSVLSLSVGWFLDHHVWQTDYSLSSSKNIQPLKIAMFADAHLGTTFNAKGFAKHLSDIKASEPDLIIIAGDFVDDGTTKQEMIEAVKALGSIKMRCGIYFVHGNHDKGYYGGHRGFSVLDLENELRKNNIRVLKDEVVPIADNNFYLIGRRDYSVEKEQSGSRKAMKELVEELDKNKYIIVVDHQPTDYQNQAEAGVDLVLSGHTHGGQLFPFNSVGKWIGANENIYGYERRKNTDFIVTSGISDWAIKFKTGTKSEYVLIQLSKQKEQTD